MRTWLRAAIAIAILALSIPAEPTAAPRTPYGGQATIYVFGALPELDPRAAASAAGVALCGAVFETLYTIDDAGELVPVLARGLPVLEGRELIVPLRAGVELHDGTTLTPAMARDALLALAAPGARSGHVLLPLEREARPEPSPDPSPGGAAGRPAGPGPREAAAPGGGGAPLVRARAEDPALIFTLAAPYPEYARLLASPRAAIRAPGGHGTGPFKVEANGDAELVALAPFLGHAGGRPFLDGITVRPALSRFGTVAMLEKGRADVVFGLPDTRRLEDAELLPWGGGRRPAELIVLSVGWQLAELRTPAALAAMSASLHRQTLAHRFLGQGAEPAETLLGAPSPTGREPAQGPKVDATLLVSRDDPALRRAAERVQLDLLGAGITVTIDRAPSRALEDRRRDGRFALMLDRFQPDGPAGASAIDRLHAVLSAGAMAAAPSPTLLSPAELAAFVGGREAERTRMLPALERLIRERAALIPIATSSPAVAVKRGLDGVRLGFAGEVILEDAHRRALEPTAGREGSE